MGILRTIITGALLSPFAVLPTEAAVLRTINFVATDLQPSVTPTTGFDLLGIGPVGAIRGSITFDVSAPPLRGSLQNAGTPDEYDFRQWTYLSFKFRVGRYEFDVPGTNPSDRVYRSLTVVDGIGSNTRDRVYASTDTWLDLGGGLRVAPMLSLTFDDEKAFSGTAVPSNSKLRMLSDGSFSFDVESDPENLLTGPWYNQVRILPEVSTVPLPPAFSLTAIGLGFFAIFAAKRRKGRMA